MTLTTHALVGTAAAELFPQHPFIAFCSALASHFLLDAIPHWDYKLKSYHRDPHDPMKNTVEINGDFFIDLARLATDALIGIVLALVIFQPNTTTYLIVGLGIIGGVLPDFLQFLYFKIRREPFTTMQRIHNWAHAKKHLRNTQASLAIQACLVVLAVFVSQY